MEKHKVLIVEDDLIIAGSMRATLKNNGYFVTAIATSYDEALAAIQQDLPDIVIMDIQLNGKIDGISAAKSIKKLIKTSLIFVTELQDEKIFNIAMDAFPQNYITKPFTDVALLKAVALAVNISKEHLPSAAPKPQELVGDAVFVLTNGSHAKLTRSDILYIKSKGAYTEIYYETQEKTKEAFYTLAVSSNHVVEQLAMPTLLRVNKSCHVNIQKIEKFQRNAVGIKGLEIPVTKEHINELKKRLQFIKNGPSSKG